MLDNQPEIYEVSVSEANLYIGTAFFRSFVYQQFHNTITTQVLPAFQVKINDGQVEVS